MTNTILTPEEIAELKTLTERMTAAPWMVHERAIEQSAIGKALGRCEGLTQRLIGTAWDHPQLHGPALITRTMQSGFTSPEINIDVETNNAAGIVALRNAAPSLLFTIEALRGQLEAANERASDYLRMLDEEREAAMIEEKRRVNQYARVADALGVEIGETNVLAATRLRAENERLTAENRALRDEFAVQFCRCGYQRRSCNYGLRHKIRSRDGAYLCATCKDAPVAVFLPEAGKAFCASELLDTLFHEGEERDGDLNSLFRFIEDRLGQKIIEPASDQRSLLAIIEGIVASLRSFLSAAEERVRRASELLHAANPEEMGGTPDLFAPAQGWDTWQDEVTVFLSTTTETEEHGRVGIAVTCTTCHMRKKPIGRSAPLVMANSLCDHECPGYDFDPKPGTLWPGETCADFGYAHSHEATTKTGGDDGRS